MTLSLCPPTGDNWEATTLFFALAFQITSSGVIHSLGGRFRLPVWRNHWLCLSAAAFYGLWCAMLLAPPSTFTAVLHVASIGFNSAETANPVWQAYQQDAAAGPSAGMSFDFRLKLLGIYVSGNLCSLLWQAVVVQGPGRSVCVRKFPPDSASDGLHV